MNDFNEATDHIASAASLIRRRKIIKLGLFLGVGVSVFGVTGCENSSEIVNSKNAKKARYIRNKDIPLINKLIVHLLPSNNDVLTPAVPELVFLNMDALVGKMDLELRSDVNLIFDVFNMSSILLGGHFCKFENLPKKSAIQYLERWQDGVTLQRAIVTSLKKFIYLSYWREESTWKAIGYDGPVSDRWGLVSLGDAPIPGNDN
jgi:hypothetical protein